MATAIHINYDSGAVTQVTGVSGYRLVINRVTSPTTAAQVAGGVVFRTNTSSELKNYLTALLAAIAAAGAASGWSYVSQFYTIGTDYEGFGESFYHSSNGTTHVVIRRFLKAYAASVRQGDYHFELNLDGKYNEASTDAKTFYDDLATAKNAL